MIFPWGWLADFPARDDFSGHPHQWTLGKWGGRLGLLKTTHLTGARTTRAKNVRKTSPISMKTRENFTALGGHEVKNSDVVKTIINHPSVITMFIGDMVAIPRIFFGGKNQWHVLTDRTAMTITAKRFAGTRWTPSGEPSRGAEKLSCVENEIFHLGGWDMGPL